MQELFDVLFNKNAAIKETEDEYGWPCLCKQCGWYGKSKELLVSNQYYCEDYHPFFCPKCLADEYSIVDIMEEGYTPNFKDKLKFFFRKITFYQIRHSFVYTHMSLSFYIKRFLKTILKKCYLQSRERKDFDVDETVFILLKDEK